MKHPILRFVALTWMAFGAWGLIGLSLHPVPLQAAPALTKGERAILAMPGWSLSSTLPFLIGLRRGYYQEEGIDLRLLVIKSDVALRGMLNGNVDYLSALGTTVRAAAKGIAVRLVMATYNQPIFYIVARPEIRSVAAIKGKRVGVDAFGATTDVAMREGLRHFGLDPERDATFLSLGGTHIRYAALKAGSIDATILSPPFNVLAKREGFQELLYVGDILDLPLSGVGTTTKKLAESPEAVKRMIRGTVRALRYYVENREVVVGIIQKEWELDREVAGGVYDTAVRALSKDGSVSEKGLRLNIELERVRLELKQEPTLASIADFTLLQAVQRELKLK